MASLLDIIGDIGRQRSQASAGAGGLLMERPLENAALATMFTPVVGDVTGLLADAKMYATEPEERNLLNYTLTAASVLPFVPAVAAMKKVGKAKPKTNAEKVAQEILDLLEAGEIEKITEDMLSQADDAYLAKNYDLPMDTESRLARAKEMGFDTESVMYHGTNHNFDIFKPQYSRGERVGVFTTDSPEVAETYASTLGGTIYPVLQRDNSVDLGEIIIDAEGANWNQIEGSMPAYAPEVGDENVQFYFPDIDFGYRPATTNDLADFAKFEGRPRIVFENIVDRGPVPSRASGIGLGGSPNNPSTVTSNFYSNALRSPFARFDPRLKDFGNILAGVAPVAVLTPSVVRGLLDTEEER